MSEPKHTPGPWIIDPDNPYRVISEYWGGITFVYNEPAENEPLMQMARASAKLIAAAPELLANLKQTVVVLQVIDPNNPAISMAEAAIAKATN